MFFNKKKIDKDGRGSDSDRMVSLTDSLYKQNIEIVSKNKSLSAMKKLYDVSILILKRKDLADRIVRIIREELDLELVGIFILDKEKSLFDPLSFTSSDRLIDKQNDLDIDFNTIKIPTDSSDIVRDVFEKKSILHTDKLSKVWGNIIKGDVYKELHDVGHIKTLILSPLVIDEEVIGLSTFAMNREYDQLSDHEIEMISSFSNIISVSIDRVIVYEKLTSVNEQLETANENQQKLLHFISHQVKGFLTRSISVFSEALSGSYGDISSDMRDLLEKGLASERKGVETVQEIFFSSDLRKGTITFDKNDSIDLSETVKEIYDLEKSTADNKGLEIDLKIAENLPEIKGDKDKIKEVFKNLIENAIIYTPKGVVEILLEKSDDGVLFSVKDQGVGLSDEDKKVLFTEGGRGKDSLKVNAETSGYGLYIAKQVVEAHGGKIWAESEGRDKGSTFNVLFPVA